MQNEQNPLVNPENRLKFEVRSFEELMWAKTASKLEELGFNIIYNEAETKDSNVIILQHKDEHHNPDAINHAKSLMLKHLPEPSAKQVVEQKENVTTAAVLDDLQDLDLDAEKEVTEEEKIDAADAENEQVEESKEEKTDE